MRLYIKHGDNHLYNVFDLVLKMLLLEINDSDDIWRDKSYLCNVINNLSYGAYLITNVNGTLNKDWLVISEDCILIDDEIDEYMKTDYVSGFHTEIVLDTNLNYQNNNPIIWY